MFKETHHCLRIRTVDGQEYTLTSEKYDSHQLASIIVGLNDTRIHFIKLDDETVIMTDKIVSISNIK